MSDAGGTILSLARGSAADTNVYGQPIANPKFKRLRFTTDGQRANYKTVESRELVSSFRVKQMRRVGQQAGGNIGTELVWGNLDDIIESLVFGRWIRTPQRFNAVSDQEITDVAAGTGVITVLAALATDENRQGTFGVGHLVRRTGFTNAGNNGLARVTAATGTSLTIPTAGLVNESAPPTAARLKVVGIEAPANGNIQTTTSGLAPGSVAAITGTGVDFVALGIIAGMRFKLSNCPTAANNSWYRALSVASGRIECDLAPPNFATDTAAAAQIRIWFGDTLRDGANPLIWFDIERHLPQLVVPEYHYNRSMVPKALSLELAPQEIKNCSIEWVGARRTTGVARVAGASDLAVDALGAIPRLGDMFDTSNNVAEIKLGNTRLVDVVSRCAWSIDNGISGLQAIGSDGTVRIQRPRFRPTLSIASYYDSRAQLASLEADTLIGVSSVFTDPIGTRAVIIDYPAAKVSQGDPEGIQADGVISLPLTIAAVEHVGFNCAMQYSRIEEFA